MNCCWCGANADGSSSHGICDACILVVFGVDPATIHEEIEAEQEQEQVAA
jgi:NMD protein affecting ribosome stability and mRNA decay